jgi:hypothetical protein
MLRKTPSGKYRGRGGHTSVVVERKPDKIIEVCRCLADAKWWARKYNRDRGERGRYYGITRRAYEAARARRYAGLDDVQAAARTPDTSTDTREMTPAQMVNARVNEELAGYENAFPALDKLKAQEARDEAERSADETTALLPADQKLKEFFSKHALGPLARPSCIVCGHVPKDWPLAIQHMELPGIVVCFPCRDAAQAARIPAETTCRHEPSNFPPISGEGFQEQKCLKCGQPADTSDAPPCTCHPGDNPPRPCPRKYAIHECRAAAAKQHADTSTGSQT